MTTELPSTSTLVTAISTTDRSTVYVTLTATFSNAVTIALATASLTNGDVLLDPQESGSNLSTGAIAGGVIGGLLAVTILGILSFCVYRNRKRKRVDRATSDLNRVLAGGIVQEKGSSSGGGSGNASRNQSHGRFSFAGDEDEMEDGGIHLAMGGTAEGSIEDDPSTMNHNSNHSNTNSVAGYVHGSSAGATTTHYSHAEGDELASTTALSRHASDSRSLLTNRPPIQQQSSSTSLLSPTMNDAALIPPTSPMSIASLGQEPLDHATVPMNQPHSPSSYGPSVYRTTSPQPLHNNGNGTVYPVSAPNTLGRAGGSRSTSRSGAEVGEEKMWLRGEEGGNVTRRMSNRPAREMMPSSAPSQIQQFSPDLSNGAVYVRYPPLSRSPPPPMHPNHYSPQKRHTSYNSSRPASPVNHGGQKPRQNSYNLSNSRPTSPIGNSRSLPPSRYSHLDYPKQPPPSTPVSPQEDKIYPSTSTQTLESTSSSRPISFKSLDSNTSSSKNSPKNSRPTSASAEQPPMPTLETYQKTLANNIQKQLFGNNEQEE